MEDNNDKILAALDALLNDNSVVFDELVADIMQDKVGAAVEAKREEMRQSVFAEPEADEVEESDEIEENDEIEETDNQEVGE